jgi:hypothetical protein
MIITFEQAETVLNELIEDYLSDLGDNCDGNGNIKWGKCGVGYESEVQLVEDLLLYIKNK